MSRMAQEKNDNPKKLILRKTGNLDEGPYLHCAPAPRRNLAGDFDGFVKVIGVEEEESPQLFAGFGKGAIGKNALSLPRANTRGGGRRLQRRNQDPLSTGMEFHGVSGRFPVAVGPLLFGK
jgi:hypothetical protein